ncbi:MAG: hypothetical protein GKR96_11825 [Gammaproteobacteria bacterium]|nr:hypothetical protein [Gammaproteobacteria bacterium]
MNQCDGIHRVMHGLKRHQFPFDKSAIPKNGIYILFEKGETGHGGDRIVRVGTHTGENQLQSRLRQHFLNENKDRSIFRKNIGRSMLNQENNSFLRFWELDLTTQKARETHSSSIDFDYQESIEARVSQYIQANVSFCVMSVDSRAERLEIESKMISTVCLCKKCSSSTAWLGNFSTKGKIAKSGLWQVNELYKTPFDASEVTGLWRRMKVENQNHDSE